MIPDSVKGFSFLKFLKLHMSSYKEKDDDNSGITQISYPLIKKNTMNQKVHPVNSAFDKEPSHKRKISLRQFSNINCGTSGDGSDSVRKYFKKF